MEMFCCSLSVLLDVVFNVAPSGCLLRKRDVVSKKYRTNTMVKWLKGFKVIKKKIVERKTVNIQMMMTKPINKWPERSSQCAMTRRAVWGASFPSYLYWVKTIVSPFVMRNDICWMWGIIQEALFMPRFSIKVSLPCVSYCVRQNYPRRTFWRAVNDGSLILLFKK